MRATKKCRSIAKECKAAGACLWHDATVLAAQLQKFEKLRHTIRAEWSALLQQEPAATALANPDTLVYLMDRSLDQLIAGLRQPDEKWLRRAAGLGRPLRESCRCGLSPLIVYFSTGELALRAAAARRHAEDLPEILLLFHAIAHEEINALCSMCQRDVDGAPPSLGILRPNAAAWPARPSATAP
jgi:hypothetical protein